MFSWLKSLFAKKQSTFRVDLFDPEERMIYEHLCGFDAEGRKVYVRKDPMVLWQKVTEQSASIDADVKVARSPSKAAAERYASLCLKLRAIFEIPPFDRGGLPDALILQLFGHFMAYTETLKKNSQPTTTSATATSLDTPPSPGNSTAHGSATPTTSASTSTADAACTASPTPSA